MERLGRHGQRLKALRRRARERRPGEVVVDGWRLAGDLADHGVEIGELYLAEGRADTPEARALVDASREAYLVAPSVLAEIAPTRHPQGVLAVVAEPSPGRWRARSGIALYLERIQDPGNLGAIVRTAAGLGADAVLLSAGCADPFHPAAVRGSAGAVFALVPERGRELDEVASAVRGAGGEVWAAAPVGDPLAVGAAPRPTLVLLGAEGSGLSAGAREAADRAVAITLGRGVESLNVAVAAGVLLALLRAPGPNGGAV